MNIFSLSLSYLRHKSLNSFLTVSIFASGVAMIVFILLINAQLQDEFKRNLNGIDLVVGSKGSPMQLIMSVVFHLDIPTGSISLKEAESLRKDPLVAKAIPIALGDNFKGFRVVGSTKEYLDLYQGRIKNGGQLWNNVMEVVLGSDMAAKTGLKIGDTFSGSHGLTSGGAVHEDQPYRVVGILEKSGSILDRLAITELESIWHVHGLGNHGDHDEDKNDHESRNISNDSEHIDSQINIANNDYSITAMLISYSSPMGAVILPRSINNSTSMQAASPASEVARLNSFMGSGTDILQSIAWFMIILSGFSIFTGLYTAMDERRYDLALIRSLGASSIKIELLILCESMILAMTGLISGLVLGHAMVELFGISLSDSKHLNITGNVFLLSEVWLLPVTILIGCIAGLIPAMRVRKIDIFETLIHR